MDSTAVSQIFALSLTARGKHSPSQTWLRKWKADFWMRPLFSQMSQISHGQTTLHTWLEGFCPSVGPASPSPVPENEKPQRTSDGSSTSSQAEFPFFAPECSSQRMSKDSSPQGCQTDQASSGIVSRDWKAYITKLRQAYSLRVKSAHRTSGSEFLSSGWPTPQANEIENPNKVYRSPTNAYRGNKKVQPMLADVCKHGPAAPANPSTDGNRQGLWRTPSVAEEKNQNTSTQIYLQNQVGATPKAWATPNCRDSQGVPGPAMANQKSLPRDMKKETGSGRLNGQWVTQLMGLPMGWVTPSCPASVIRNWPRFVSGWLSATIAPTNSDSSETESCQQPQKELFEF